MVKSPDTSAGCRGSGRHRRSADVHAASAGCSPRRRNSALARATTVSFCAHHRVDQPDSPALAVDAWCPRAPVGQRGGPKQVDGQPRGLELGIAAVAFDGPAEQAADVVAADRLTPRARARSGCGTSTSPSAVKKRRGRADWRRDPGVIGPTISGCYDSQPALVDTMSVRELVVLLDVSGHHRAHGDDPQPGVAGLLQRLVDENRCQTAPFEFVVAPRCG